MRGGLGILLAAFGALLAAPVAAVRVEQQVERRHAVATLGAGRVAEVLEVEAPGLVRIDLAATSRDRPAPAARVRLVEWPGGTERVSQLLPRRLPPPGGHEYTSLHFPAVRDSGGRAFQLSVEREGPLDRSEIRLWGRRGDAGSGLSRNGVPTGGRLAYRAWHRVTGWAALPTLGERMAAVPLGVGMAAAGGLVALAYGVGLVAFVGRLRAAGRA